VSNLREAKKEKKKQGKKSLQENPKNWEKKGPTPQGIIYL